MFLLIDFTRTNLKTRNFPDKVGSLPDFPEFSLTSLTCDNPELVLGRREKWKIYP